MAKKNSLVKMASKLDTKRCLACAEVAIGAITLIAKIWTKKK